MPGVQKHTKPIRNTWNIGSLSDISNAVTESTWPQKELTPNGPKAHRREALTEVAHG